MGKQNLENTLGTANLGDINREFQEKQKTSGLYRLEKKIAFRVGQGSALGFVGGIIDAASSIGLKDYLGCSDWAQNIPIGLHNVCGYLADGMVSGLLITGAALITGVSSLLCYAQSEHDRQRLWSPGHTDNIEG